MQTEEKRFETVVAQWSTGALKKIASELFMNDTMVVSLMPPNFSPVFHIVSDQQQKTTRTWTIAFSS
jgi:hypothetical protein